ncbi:flagellar FliJ family protein [Acetobacter orientalis]|uniref:flagellar FliJ family protein n=1 Tax=Acetobacter orientalis TaxID=146474 RepID=UPI0020A17227|nr:flagellar FliJ family protein [Acetobacter orientalis]MCP1216562.1 flagellar FliJ family protein [Acetobacter orientalis]MCP1219682.1 flagellar FliJ family protein [Acetobacter orientalis]
MNARLRALQALIRLRKMDLDEARSRLSYAMAQETAAQQEVQRLRTEMQREREQLDVSPASAEAFRNWLPLAENILEKACQELHDAHLVSEQAGAFVVHAKAALQAAEKLLEKQLEQEKIEADRRTQAEMDDLSVRCRSAFLELGP